MRNEFANFLVHQGCVNPEDARGAATAAHDFREVIGSLALRYDLMNPNQVDTVLSQLTPEQKFGEVAVEQGFLTRFQVDCLLQIQALEEIIEIGGNLMLGGKIGRDELLEKMQVFLGQLQLNRPVVAGRMA